MMDKINQHMTTLFALLVAVGAAGALGLSLNTRHELTPPVTVHETRLGSVDGHSVVLEFRAERHRNCQLVAMTQWRDKNNVIGSKVNNNKAALTPGEERWIALELALPPSVKPGPYSVRSVAEYTCAGGSVFVVPTAWVDVHIMGGL